MDSPVPPTHLVVWRCTTVDAGGLCVMMAGLQLTLVWPVVSLGFLLLVPPGPQAVLEGEMFVLYRALGCHGNRMFPKWDWSGVGNFILKPRMMIIIVRSNIPMLQYDMG